VIPPLSNLTLQRLASELVIVRTDGLRVVELGYGYLRHIVAQWRAKAWHADLQNAKSPPR